MDRFVSTFTNRIDAKGRVSIPAPFRSVLERDRYCGAAELAMYCYPALGVDAIDAGGARLAQKSDRILEGFPEGSDERDKMALALYGEARTVAIDADGRIVLPREFRPLIGLPDGVSEITFVGMGDKFQLWTPGLFEQRRAEAREMVLRHLGRDGAGHRSPEGTGGGGEGRE